MIIADTSVWIDHFRFADDGLKANLATGAVLMHPFIIGELALGNLRARAQILESLGLLPMSPVATDAEVRLLVERERLAGLGVGYIDVHLIASARLSGKATLWTRDRRLHAIAQRMGVADARA